VLYNEAGQSTAGGLFYFRIPQFKIPGRYSISFDFPTEAPPAYRKLDPVSQIVSVVPMDESSSSSNSSRNSNSNPSLLEGGGPRGLALGDLTRSTEKTRRMRSQGGPLGGSSVASSSSAALLGGGGGGGGGTASGGGGLGTGGGGGIKRQQSLEEEFASLVEQSAEFVLTLEDVEQKGRLVSLVIPGGLRLRLAEEWFVVTRRRHLVGSVPRGVAGGSGGGGSSSSSSSSSSSRKQQQQQQQQHRQWPNVGEIIRAYEKTLSSSSSSSSSSSDSKGWKGGMGERLCTLFDGALGNLLLYRFEMNHYLGVLERLGVSKRPHQVWGAEHLLRLLAICPRLLAVQSRSSSSSSSSSSSDDDMVGGEGEKGAGGGGVLVVEEAEEARVYLQGLLDYLAKKQDTLFAPYEEQPRDFGLDVARSVRPS